MHLSPTVYWAAVRSKAVVLLLLIHCLLLLPLLFEFCVWSLFYYVELSDLSNFTIILMAGEDRARCFTSIVFLVFCDC